MEAINFQLIIVLLCLPPRMWNSGVTFRECQVCLTVSWAVPWQPSYIAAARALLVRLCDRSKLKSCATESIVLRICHALYQDFYIGCSRMANSNLTEALMAVPHNCQRR